jgi:hypothetical protein
VSFHVFPDRLFDFQIAAMSLLAVGKSGDKQRIADELVEFGGTQVYSVRLSHSLAFSLVRMAHPA